MKGSHEGFDSGAGSLFSVQVPVINHHTVVSREEAKVTSSAEGAVVARPPLSGQPEGGALVVVAFDDHHDEPSSFTVTRRLTPADDIPQVPDEDERPDNVRKLPDTGSTRRRGPAVAAAAGAALFSLVTAACTSGSHGGENPQTPGIVKQLEQAGRNALNGVKNDSGRLEHGVRQVAKSTGPQLGQAARHAEQQADKEGNNLIKKAEKQGHPSPTPRPSRSPRPRG